YTTPFRSEGGEAFLDLRRQIDRNAVDVLRAAVEGRVVGDQGRLVELDRQREEHREVGFDLAVRRRIAAGGRAESARGRPRPEARGEGLRDERLVGGGEPVLEPARRAVREGAEDAVVPADLLVRER